MKARSALALALVIHALFLYSLATGLLDPLFNDTTHRGAPGSDFFVIYKAGRNVLRGESPYRIDREEPPRSWGDYRYLPLSAFTLSTAVALLPPEAARRAWIIGSECLLAAVIAATFALARDRRSAMVGASLWLAFSPYYVGLFIGQFDFLVAAGVFGAAAAMLGLAPAVGAGTWVAATCAKWSGLVMAPLMLRRRRWLPLVIWSVLSLGTAAVYFSIHPADFAHFRATLMRGGFATPHAGNHGFQALISSTATFLVPDLFQDLTRWWDRMGFVLVYANLERLLLVAALGIAMWATFGGKGRQTVGEAVALWTSLLAVAYNEFWEHQYVLLLPGIVLLYLEGRRRAALAAWWPLALPTIFALVDRPHEAVVAATPMGYDNPDLFLLLSPLANLALHLCKPLAALGLFIAAAAPAWTRSGRAGAVTEPLAAERQGRG